MKKALVRISLLLAMLMMLCLCFVACGQSDTPPSTAPSSSTESSNDGDEGPDGPGTDSDTTYTVKFDTSRTSDKPSIPDQVVKANGKVARPDYEPYRKGMEFYGWCVGGDKNQKWDFNKSIVTGDITLVAVFDRAGSGGSTADCEHVYEVIEYEAPTCEYAGKRVEKCVLCKDVQRYDRNNDESLKKLPHLELEERVEPTCALDGYSKIYCPNGCGLSATTKLKATGKHEYDPLGWTTVVKPTLYVGGMMENPCIHCGGAIQTMSAGYNATEDELFHERVNVSYLYTGGNYVNEKFVNVAKLGKLLVSSYFDGTKGNMAIDGNVTTFWNADTYVDGANYTSDWLELELSREFEVGALKFVLPNYYAWELGEDCYVSYKIEYLDATSGEWVYLGEVSDKNATAAGISCEFMMTLDAPIKTNKIKASVTHASRYAPAVIYEIETYAKTEAVERVPVSIAAEATVSISGKYNEWVTGGDTLKDNTTASYWTTDARYNATPWAIFEYPSDKYIACIQISVGARQNRRFDLEIYENGQWVKVTELTVPAAGVTNDVVVTNADGICTFNVNLEKSTSKIKLTLTREPEYWTSYVYDITPYTIVEQPFGEYPATGCSHANPRAGEVVPASCGVPGYTVMNCTCGAVIRTKATDALVHDWGKYTIETAATATTLGTKVSTCRNEGCGATSTMSYAENYVNPVVTPYLHNAPSAWAQTFDDGNYLDTYTWANEYYIRYGVRATLMMSITYSDALVSIWQEHFTRGVFDLGSHSYNHTSIYSGQATGSALLGEVVVAQYWFRHHFKGQQVITFAAPLGATSTSVADYLAGTLAANRNGGDTGIFYNTPDQLTNREIWGDLNSYISKADQTEGEYIFVKKDGSVVYLNKATEGATEVTFNGAKFYLTEEYKKAGVNLVFDESVMTFVDMGYDAGTYYYNDYKYEFRENGSYNLNGSTFEFVDGNGGEYRLLKATIGSYEKGVEKLYSVGGFTVECLHSLGSGSIYSSYASTISKLEHITRFGMWAPSYNDLVKYLKEAQKASVETLERTDSSITISVTDGLDDFMFDQALTIKVDIPDSWTTVTATQGGKNIPFVALSEYKHTKHMNNISCTIEDGFLYVDVVPDAGDVVITLGEKNESADYEEKVTITFEPGEGKLDWDEYEMYVSAGTAYDSLTLPTPTREGYKFLGWDVKEVEGGFVFTEDTTLNAVWEEIPKCTDGSYNHKWGNWTVATDNVSEVRVCSKCQAEEKRPLEVLDETAQ